MRVKTLLTVLVLVICGAGFFYWQNRESVAEEEPAAGQQAQQAMPVDVMTVKTQAVNNVQEYSGRITAYKISAVRPQVSGIITERLFEEGSDVTEGQQMYQIDPAPYQAAVNSARADLQKAVANEKSVRLKAKRYADLVKMQAVSKQEYDDAVAAQDQAKADIAIAKAALDTAQINVNYTKVYAPISGRVGQSNFTEGALVTANQSDALATITQLDPVYVDMTQASKDVMGMRRMAQDSQNLTVKLIPEGSNQPYEHNGEIKFSDVTVDESTGMVKIRAVFPNPESLLLPGQYVRAQIIEQQGQGILIPQNITARNTQGQLYVYVVGEGNKLKTQVIESNQAVGNRWLISSGLKDGDVVVASSLQKVKADMIVQPVPKQEVSQEQKQEAEMQKAEEISPPPELDASQENSGPSQVTDEDEIDVPAAEPAAEKSSE